MCLLQGISRWLVYRRGCRRDDGSLLLEIEEISVEYLGYGYRRVRLELARRGRACSEHLVRRLMRENGLMARRPKSKGVTRPRILDRRQANLVLGLKPDRQDQVWAADTTLVHVSGGSLYLAAVLDLFSRRVVGWHLSRRNDEQLTLACLAKALSQRRPALGWIHHSDRGSTYTSSAYVAAVRTAGGRLSLSQPGRPRENAYAESFFRTLKLEEVDRNRYESFLEAQSALGRYIESIYNRQRMHSSLGYTSPDQFERCHAR
jgi:putative transposase